MSKFNYVKALAVNADKVKEYELAGILVGGESPVLMVAPATEANRDYYNSLLRRASKAAKRVKSGKITKALIDENRADDVEDFSKHVIKGWRNVVDDKGKAVEFSPEDCLDLLKALPSWVIDDLRAFASNPENFSEQIDIDDLAKN